MLDDLLSLEEFASRRREFFESHLRYLDRNRRVRLGPHLTLLFENRQTLWFRVQEVLRITRLNEPSRVQQELDLYNRLLPGRDQLQASLVLALDEGRLAEELMPWQHFRGDDLCLRVGEHSVPAVLVTCRPEDLAIGTAHWLRFAVPPKIRGLFADLRVPSWFEVIEPKDHQESALLGEEVRQSLLDDLELSDRD
jgi:hypothetical protein